MTNYLIFQLYAPLASWGTQAVGEVRTADIHPSRSALLGLLAAALRIKRDDVVKQTALQESCHFAAKVCSVGHTLRDYHTIQTPTKNKKNKHLYTRRDELLESKLNTTISDRYYQQEQVSVIAVWLAEESTYSLQQLELALNAPGYHLYLGRKSCPLAIPLSASMISADTLKAALDSFVVDDMLTRLVVGEKHPQYYWEPTDNLVSGLTVSYSVSRYDQQLSRTRWQFTTRKENVSLSGRG